MESRLQSIHDEKDGIIHVLHFVAPIFCLVEVRLCKNRGIYCSLHAHLGCEMPKALHRAGRDVISSASLAHNT